LASSTAHVIEPDVRIEKIMLAANTPALRLSPEAPGPHPIALLAHGATGSKEKLSMGGGAGEWSVTEDAFRPRLFIGVGADA
jgi:hypothetical protein